MKYVKSLAILLSTVLMLSGTLGINAQPLNVTLLTLDQPDPKSQLVVVTSDEVTFAGMLTTLDGTGLVNMTIDIVESKASGSSVLVSAMTDANGAFTAKWMADLDDPANDRVMSVFASFNGSALYAAARSGSVSVVVAIQDLKVNFSFDKQVYFSGETATFTIKFSDPKGMPVDPERIRAVYDLTLVSFERRSEGVYTYVTPPLTPPTHTLQVVAEKHGFKLLNDASTISVFARQTLPGVKLNFDWEPKQIVTGVPVSFILSFTDLNNVFTPFVNYTFTVKQGNQLLMQLPNQQTTEGTATHVHTFESAGQYRVTVDVGSIGQAPSSIRITQSFDYNIDVINPATLAVKAKALQKGDLMRITFSNPSNAITGIYTIQLTLSGTTHLKIRGPTGWDVQIEGNTVKLTASDKPLEPGKRAQVRAKIAGALDTFDWSVMDKDGNVLKSSTTTVFQLRVRS